MLGVHNQVDKAQEISYNQPQIGIGLKLDKISFEYAFWKLPDVEFGVP